MPADASPLPASISSPMLGQRGLQGVAAPVEYRAVKYKDGSSYEGHWAQNKRHGHGSYRFANGDTYNGWFNMGKKDGQATYVSSAQDGTFYGEFKDGAPVAGAWIFTDGRYDITLGAVHPLS
eukprot:SAG31_NODE_498_length_14861_cov_3.405026_12_plen_122_part_00